MNAGSVWKRRSLPFCENPERIGTLDCDRAQVFNPYKHVAQPVAVGPLSHYARWMSPTQSGSRTGSTRLISIPGHRPSQAVRGVTVTASASGSVGLNQVFFHHGDGLHRPLVSTRVPLIDLVRAARLVRLC